MEWIWLAKLTAALEESVRVGLWHITHSWVSLRTALWTMVRSTWQAAHFSVATTWRRATGLLASTEKYMRVGWAQSIAAVCFTVRGSRFTEFRASMATVEESV